MSSYRLYLLISGLGSFASRTAFTLNLIYQATVVGLSPLQLVLVGTLMEAVCFVAQVPTGVIADRYSRRLSVIAGYLLMGAGLLVWGLLPTYAAILVANVIWAVGAVCVDGAEEAWAADEIEPRLVTRAFVRGGQVAQAGSLLGIVAAVALTAVAPALPIVVGAVLTLALGLLLMLLMTENNWRPSPATTGSMRRQVVEGAQAVRHSAVLAAIVGGALFAGMSSEGFDRLSQPFLLPFIGDLPTELVFGGLAVVAALGSIVVTGLAGRWIDVVRPERVGRVLAAVQALTAAGLIGLGFAGHWWAAVGLYLAVRLLRDTATPILNVWLVSATAPGSRATVFSIVSQADALGQVAGGPPAGFVAQRRAIGAGISVAGLFVLPAVALFALATKQSAADPATTKANGPAAAPGTEPEPAQTTVTATEKTR
ncbi:MFS transporter [Actinoplanes sp. LDG1-06]|uniref:MFS transporter n=1 Tax=Paractinoplanes ovalisporus TaxID=2810368 RepID=A0ABS2AQ66_9ACTN|nr:MFS transporter [Actinoplanes ovalisporus]MBM2621946.1 MFS transporter [Actinoplanes ovalisporus]